MKGYVSNSDPKFTANRELIKQAQKGCQESKEELLKLNAGLVEQLTRKYLGDKQDYDDIQQTANLALLKAIERFDLTKPYQFSSFAYITIKGEILNYFRSNSTIRKKRTSNFLYKKISDYRYDYYAKHQEYPTNKDIADFLDEDVDEIENVLLENQPLTYLSGKPISNDDEEASFENIIPDNKHEEYELVLLNQLIESQLTEEEVTIFNYNLSGLARREISEKLGISEGKIRYTLQRITSKLTKAFAH